MRGALPGGQAGRRGLRLDQAPAGARDAHLHSRRGAETLPAGAAKVEDGLDLFHGFRKKGLRQEVAPAFYAAVSAYAARCGYCTAYVEAELRQAPRYPAKPTRWWRWRNTAESTKQSW